MTNAWVAGAAPGIIDAIEQAGFASWPALEEQRMPGWLLRASQGYTRRANSANAVAARVEHLDADLPAIERFFEQRGLPPTFRLLSTPGDEALDSRLQHLGYRLCDDPCLVMRRPLHRDAPPAPMAGIRLLADAGTWLAEFARIKHDEGPHQRIHQAMLASITGPVAFATFQPPGAREGLACGLGVVSSGHLGLFDIATHGDHRRQGLASALCAGLLRWGQALGAHNAYLQVVATNRHAVELYRRLGFEELYRYWYRTRA